MVCWSACPPCDEVMKLRKLDDLEEDMEEFFENNDVTDLLSELSGETVPDEEEETFDEEGFDDEEDFDDEMLDDATPPPNTLVFDQETEEPIGTDVSLFNEQVSEAIEMSGAGVDEELELDETGAAPFDPAPTLPAGETGTEASFLDVPGTTGTETPAISPVSSLGLGTPEPVSTLGVSPITPPPLVVQATLTPATTPVLGTDITSATTSPPVLQTGVGTITEAPVVIPIGIPTFAPGGSAVGPAALPGTTQSPVASSQVTLAPVLPDTIPSSAIPQTSSSSPVHDKEDLDRPKSTRPGEHDNYGRKGKHGIFFSAILMTGVVFGLIYFTFCRRPRRRDGMREMEMSTWVNGDDDNGIL